MESCPPRLMESIAAALIPPACREHVLGDLHERYRSPWRYLLDCLSTIPAVVVSRVRRTLDMRRFLTDAVALYASFLAFQWQSGEPVEVTSIAILAGMAALALHDAYAMRDAPGRRSVVGSAAGTIAAGVLTRWMPWMAFRGAAGWFLLIAASYGRGAELPSPASAPKDLRSEAMDFEKRIRSRNRREFVAAAIVVIVFLAYIRILPDVWFRVACGLIIAGVLFVGAYLNRNGAPRPVPKPRQRMSWQPSTVQNS